ncbi:hypothetical protein MTR67_011227 [Solanum verrucosum]|uniref:Uncharacterized protein n=1 Tax=Solanum verrucosum TaxID=315347 RepID=A0AAF0TEW8_SOLVR|nr:hypothetical protein MTR67_011227 [Solanum verrucosum]
MYVQTLYQHQTKWKPLIYLIFKMLILLDPPQQQLMQRKFNKTQFIEDFSTSLPGHLFRRSSRVSGTSSPPPPKRRKKIDTSKTKVSEPKSSELLRPPINQSFSMPDEAPTPIANVSCVHVSSQGQKDKSVYPDIEELKQHMKDYVSNDIKFFFRFMYKYKIEC